MIRLSVQEKPNLRLIPASTDKNWGGTKLAFSSQNEGCANIGLKHLPLSMDTENVHEPTF